MSEINERRHGYEGLAAEIASIHRENIKRDQIIADMANDLKELVALANKGRGGFWAGMVMASLLGSIVTYIVQHFSFKG